MDCQACQADADPTYSPNENGLRLDSQSALDFVLSHPALEKTRIFLYGQSIGGAVSIDLASRNTSRVSLGSTSSRVTQADGAPRQIHGLIVENTFLSLPKLVPHVLPFLGPFLFLLHQKWPSEDRIDAITVPSLFLSGRRDELVPPAHMRSLFERSSSQIKEWKEFEAGTHSTFHHTHRRINLLTGNLFQTTLACSRGTSRPSQRSLTVTRKRLATRP